MNLRPPRPEHGALPNCATFRFDCYLVFMCSAPTVLPLKKRYLIVFRIIASHLQAVHYILLSQNCRSLFRCYFGLVRLCLNDALRKILSAESNCATFRYFIFKKSERQDLNLRPLPPQGSALPSCATSRLVFRNLTPLGSATSQTTILNRFSRQSQAALRPDWFSGT